MNTDDIQIEVLEDGRIKITTGAIGAVNHTTADRLLKDIIALAGGEVQTTKNEKGHHHHHHHGDHTHSHKH
jgi:hypothetical protein